MGFPCVPTINEKYVSWELQSHLPTGKVPQQVSGPDQDWVPCSREIQGGEETGLLARRGEACMGTYSLPRDGLKGLSILEVTGNLDSYICLNGSLFCTVEMGEQ